MSWPRWCSKRPASAPRPRRPSCARLLELASDQTELPVHPTAGEVDDPAGAYDRLWAALWQDPDADPDDQADTGEETDTDGSGGGTD